MVTWPAAQCDMMFCSWICLKYVEFGLQSQEPPHRPQGPVLPVTLQSILTPISAATTAYKTVTSTTVTTTTTVAKTPTTAPALATRVSGVRTHFVLFCLSPFVLSFFLDYHFTSVLLWGSNNEINTLRPNDYTTVFNIQKSYVLSTQTVFMCFVWIWEQTDYFPIQH